MENNFHVGLKIEELLQDQHRSKRDLGLDIDMSQGNVVYLTKRESIDVQMLHKIGNNLKYNFWKHFPIDEGKGAETMVTEREKQVVAERDKMIAELQAKLDARDKEIEGLKQAMVKQENDFLLEILHLWILDLQWIPHTIIRWFLIIQRMCMVQPWLQDLQ